MIEKNTTERKMRILYDLEIIKAPHQKGETPIDGIEYCEGWHDHSNMGVSVIGFCAIWLNPDRTLVTSDPQYYIGDRFGLGTFQKLIARCDDLIGFNSKAFDDKVLGGVRTTYDILEEVRLAAWGTIDYQAVPKNHTYKLGAIAEANGLQKTGTGGGAAIEWQTGSHKKVVDYCLNDVKTTAEILNLGLQGKLIDPNTGNLLTLRSLPPIERINR